MIDTQALDESVPPWERMSALRYVSYIVATTICWIALSFLVRCVFFIGQRVRRFLPPEFAHRAFLFWLGVGDWQPKWAEWVRKEKSNGG